MPRHFPPVEEIRQQALYNITHDLTYYRAWYQFEFKLPYHHPLMQDISDEEIIQAYWEYIYLNDNKI